MAHKHTHAINYNGEWLWRGDEQSMGMIFGNLSGKNFEDKPEWMTGTHADYLAMMEHESKEAFRGREVRFSGGAVIELQDAAGTVLDTHTFA